jgi:hypothetical protein
MIALHKCFLTTYLLTAPFVEYIVNLREIKKKSVYEYIPMLGPYEYSLAYIIGVEIVDGCICINTQMQQGLTISYGNFQLIQTED